MVEAFTLRRGTPEDSRRAFDVFVPAITDLTARQGTPWKPDPEHLWHELAPMMEHLAVQAAEWWVAEDPVSGEMIGYARSVERGGLFELSEFFVHPARQSAGLGAAMLERAFPAGRGDVRAIIATTDVRALVRYYGAGTAPRFPIVNISGHPHAAPPRSAADGGLEASRAGAADLAALIEIEAEVLEFHRGDEFEWLLEHREGYIYRRGNAPVAFAFMSHRGSGPIAALEASDMVPVLEHVESRAVELEMDEVGFEVPMINEVAVRHLLGRGFRLDTFMTLFMASRPFGKFDRFIGFAPPFVL